eukprot:16163871-Heterocapsa_arctica.AAC.1
MQNDPGKGETTQLAMQSGQLHVWRLLPVTSYIPVVTGGYWWLPVVTGGSGRPLTRILNRTA